MESTPSVTKRPVLSLALFGLLGIGVLASISEFDSITTPLRALAGWKSEALGRVRVDVASAVALPPTRRMVLSGETAAWHDSRIYARATGYVDKWLVDVGDRVVKGQTLAVIDAPDLDNKLAAARANLGVAQAQENEKQANAEFAKTTYDRWANSPAGLVSI